MFVIQGQVSLFGDPPHVRVDAADRRLSLYFSSIRQLKARLASQRMKHEQIYNQKVAVLDAPRVNWGKVMDDKMVSDGYKTRVIHRWRDIQLHEHFYAAPFSRTS